MWECFWGSMESSDTFPVARPRRLRVKEALCACAPDYIVFIVIVVMIIIITIIIIVGITARTDAERTAGGGWRRR